MKVTELEAYTYEGRQLRFPEERSRVRLECSQCGQTTEQPVTPVDDERGEIICPCGALVIVS
jgi:hypothetical protein